MLWNIYKNRPVATVQGGFEEKKSSNNEKGFLQQLPDDPAE